MTGKNRIMIYGPKDDGTYVVEFSSGHEARGGGGRGLGALTPGPGTFSAVSHKTSILRSPAVASLMIVLISSVASRGRFTAARAISNAMPMRRMVSGSKRWPSRNGRMGMACSLVTGGSAIGLSATNA